MIMLLNLGRLLMVAWIIYALVLLFAPHYLHRSPDNPRRPLQAVAAFVLGHLMDRAIGMLRRRKATQTAGIERAGESGGVRYRRPSFRWRCRRRALFALLAVQSKAHRGPPPGTRARSRNKPSTVPSPSICRNTNWRRGFIPQMSLTVSPGKALEDAALAAGTLYFKSAAMFDAQSEAPFNVLLVAHPHWDSKDGDSTLEHQIQADRCGRQDGVRGGKARRNEYQQVDLDERVSLAIVRRHEGHSFRRRFACQGEQRKPRARPTSPPPNSTGISWSIETSRHRPAPGSSSTIEVNSNDRRSRRAWLPGHRDQGGRQIDGREPFRGERASRSGGDRHGRSLRTLGPRRACFSIWRSSTRAVPPHTRFR